MYVSKVKGIKFPAVKYKGIRNFIIVKTIQTLYDFVVSNQSLSHNPSDKFLAYKDIIKFLVYSLDNFTFIINSFPDQQYRPNCIT